MLIAEGKVKYELNKYLIKDCEIFLIEPKLLFKTIERVLE